MLFFQTRRSDETKNTIAFAIQPELQETRCLPKRKESRASYISDPRAQHGDHDWTVSRGDFFFQFFFLTEKEKSRYYY